MLAEGVQVHIDAVVRVDGPGRTPVRARPVRLQQRASAGEAHVAVLFVAQPRERRQQALGPTARRDEVEVAVVTPARARVGAQRQDGETADEADLHAVSARRVDEVERFVEHRVPPPGRRSAQ